MSKFSLEAILSLTDNLTKPYKNTTNKITALNKGLTGSFGLLNTGINKTIAFAGKGLLRAGQVGLGAIAVGTGIAVREFIALDESITQAGAKFKDLTIGTQEYEQTLIALSQAARDVGRDTEFSAVDAAGALDKMAMAGLRSDQSMALLRGTTNLATAANTDLTTAVDIATDSLGAFNLMVDDTAQLQENLTRVSDVMAKTTTTSNTSLLDMFEAVKKGAPAFTAAGQEIEDFAALTGVMANSGVKGSEAGTILRNVMLRLAKPTGEAMDVIKDLGVTTQDANGDFRNIIDILRDFEKGLEGMGTAQRTAALSTVFGARAVTGVNVLLAEGSRELVKYRDSLIESGGASRTMAEAMRSSIGNRLKVLKSGLTELGLQFIDAFDDKGRKALDRIIESIQGFDMNIIIDGINNTIEGFKKLGNFITEHRGLIEGLVIALGSFKLAVIAVNAVQAIQMGMMATAPILSMIKVFMSLAKTEGILATAQLALNVAMTANPVGLIIVGVAALIAGLVALGIVIYRNRDAIAAFFIAIKDLVVKGFQKIAPVLEVIGRGFMTYLLTPINLVIMAIKGLLTLLSKIPGVGDKLQPALDSLQAFQDKMNTVTLIGGNKQESTTPEQNSIDNPSTATSIESHLAIQKEKAEKERETKQRFDINLNAPSGFGMAFDGQAPSTSVQLGVQ
jgi:TP901 family phage tail tape measure protein